MMNPLILIIVIAALLPNAGHAAEISSLDIVVFGATGKVGTHVVSEALERGHRVVAVSRNPDKITRQHPQLTPAKGDVLDRSSVVELISGQDVVVISVSGIVDKSGPESAVPYRAVLTVVEVLQELGNEAPRLIHVGGSGSLRVTDSKLFADTIPKLFIPKKLEIEIAGQILVLEYLRNTSGILWTYITPPENFTNGERTAEFRIGGDWKLEDSQSRSRISRADFAVALLNEAEQGDFINQRFSVAY